MSSISITNRKNKSSSSLKTPLSPFISSHHSFQCPPTIIAQGDTSFHQFVKFSSQDEGGAEFTWAKQEESYWSEDSTASETEDDENTFDDDDEDDRLSFQVKMDQSQKKNSKMVAVDGSSNNDHQLASPVSSTSNDSSYFSNSTDASENSTPDCNNTNFDSHPRRPIPSRESSHLLETLFPILPSNSTTPIPPSYSRSLSNSTATTATRLKENLSTLFLNTLFFTPPVTPSATSDDHQILFSPAFTPGGVPSHGAMSRSLTGSKEISLSACGSAEKIRRKTGGSGSASSGKSLIGLGFGAIEGEGEERVDEDGWITWGMKRCFSLGTAITTGPSDETSNRRSSAH